MATTPGGDYCTITVEHADAASGEEERLKWLNVMAFCVAFLEWAGNAVGTLASLWATVVLLGGFCSLLTPKDFWFSTIMIFIEATRVFIRNDALVNRWLFGSTSAFRWEHFCLRPRLVSPIRANLFALVTGTCISGVDPVFWPQIVTSTIKVALLVIISQMLSRLRGQVAKYCLILVAIGAYCGGSYGFLKAPPNAPIGKELKGIRKIGPSIIAWELGTVFLVRLAAVINRRARQNARALGVIKVITAVALACIPLSQEILGSYYRYASISVALALLILSTPVNSLPFLVKRHFFRIIDEIMPIFFFWSVMFPLPGISLKVSIYMLFSLIAAVLIGNLLIPLALLQVLLSIPRLGNLLLGHHHHHDYHPLPPGASPNLVPSIVVFFFLELCQGSFYLIASLPGLFSLPFHRWLAHALGFKQDWGPKVVNLYFLQAYQTRTEKGLIRPEKQEYTRSLDRFAIESLGATSSHEMQIVALNILDNCLRKRDPKSNKKLVTEIVVQDSKNIITKIIGLISYLTGEENCGSPQRNENTAQNNSVSRMICFLIRFLTCCDEETRESSGEAQQKKMVEQTEVVRLYLEFVRRLIEGGKISARFRKDLWENPFFLDSLYDILNLENCQVELWGPVMGIIATLALDKAARQEIGSTRSIILKLMCAFLIPSENSGSSVRMAAGKALENLTIMNTVCTDNCYEIFLADRPELNLIKNLIDLLVDEEYMCVAANLLHNLCANSRDNMMDMNFRANGLLESALLPKVMEMVRTKEGKQLEAALCVASQIGYVIPECFAQSIESATDAAAAELVQKLVDTLKSNMGPCLEHTRIRRHLVEMVISIVGKSPSPSHRYIKIFVEKGMKDALNMVKGTSSKFNGKGMFMQRLPMCDLINKAKRLINMVTPVQPTTKLEKNWKIGFSSDVLGAYYIAHPPNQPTKRNTRTALVSVIGGSLTENDLIGHLKLLVHQNFVWEVQRYNENTYKVVFPSRTDLLRTTYWGSAKLQNGLSLTFEEFEEEEEEYFGHLLPTVWMRVLNLPKILRKFKIIWAISTMFGVTQKIDMKTSRKNTFGRFCVAVLEPELIPNKMDFIIGNKYFELKFEVEPLVPNTAQGIAEKGDLNMGSNAADKAKGAMEEHEGDMQMEHNWEEDDLLGEDYDDEEDETAMKKFLNVQENEPINVVKATSFAQNFAMVPSYMDAYVASTSTGRASEKATTAQHMLVAQEVVCASPTGAGELSSHEQAARHGAPALPKPAVSKTSTPRSTTRSSTTQGLQTATGHAAPQLGLKTTTKDKTEPNKLVSKLSKTRRMKKTTPSSVDGTTDGGSGAEKSSLGGPLNSLLNSSVSPHGTPNSEFCSKNMMALLSPRVSMSTLVQRSKRHAETTDMNSSLKAERRTASQNLDKHG